METEKPKRLADVELEHVQFTLEFYGGNRTKTAEALGVSLRTLRNRLSGYKKSGIALRRAPTNVELAKAKKEASRYVELTCAYCAAKFTREINAYKNCIAKEQTQFFCCREHFHNSKEPA